MSSSFNPYQVWLGLGDLVTAPNYFELLGLAETEDDPKIIAAAADRAASRVRGWRPGEHAAEWAALLDQISAAKKCLTDPGRRNKYLHSLGGNQTENAESAELSRSDWVPIRAPIDQNMYPPGLAPAVAPVSNAPDELQAAVAMQPYAATPLSMSPAGVPYLQPLDPSGLTDPMRPAVPAMNADPYAPVAPPMAPAPMDFGEAMAPAAPPSLASAATMPTVNPSIAEPARSGLFGPVLLGLAVGMVLLSIGGGYLYLNSQRGSSDSNRVAIGDPASGDGTSFEATSQEQPAKPTIAGTSSQEQPAKSPGSALNSDASLPGGNLQKQDDPSTEKSPVPESKPAVDPKPTTSEPPSTTKPEVPTKSNAKPALDAKTAPAAEIPAKTEELPKPTKEELTKLGRAMQKARDSIGAHEFDRAEAFISVASEMQRLPEHQAMLDRLKLLAKSVSDYRKAIQASIGNLAVASSFDVDNDPVIVVETGPEKVIFRMKGQNRAYVIRDMPFGLAVALASQTLVDDDPNTLTLKGAYVMASPRASQEDLKKAREFLEKAAGSVDTAKELLLLFKDKYDLAAGADN